MDVGTEWLVDAFECCGDRLADIATLRKLCGTIVAELDLHVVGEPCWQQFPSPGGVTGLYLLTESHLSLHSYPEHGVATINLYCCRARAEWDWQAQLRTILGATQVTVRRLTRGDRDAARRLARSSVEVGHAAQPADRASIEGRSAEIRL